MKDKDSPFGHSAADEVKTKQVQSEFALVDDEGNFIEVMTHSPLFRAVLERTFGLKPAGKTPTGGCRYELPLPPK